MPLVSYEDSSSESENEPEPSTSKQIDPPKPVAQTSNSTGISIARKNPKNKKIEIVIPDFEDLDSSSSEDEGKKNENIRFKPSNSKSQLTALLPPPKLIKARPATSTTASTSSALPKPVTKAPSFVPYTLTQKKKAQVKLVAKDDDDDDEESEGFFSFDDKVEPEASFTPQGVESNLNVQASVNIDPDLPSQPKDVNMPPASSSSRHELSEDQFKKLVARKFGDSVTDDIQLVDVRVDDHLVQSREYIKTITVEKNEGFNVAEGEGPNSTHKRKNHITHLAFQAKKRELDLKNQWAQNKLAKQQSRARYGF